MKNVQTWTEGNRFFNLSVHEARAHAAGLVNKAQQSFESAAGTSDPTLGVHYEITEYDNSLSGLIDRHLLGIDNSTKTLTTKLTGDQWDAADHVRAVTSDAKTGETIGKVDFGEDGDFRLGHFELQADEDEQERLLAEMEQEEYERELEEARLAEEAAAAEQEAEDQNRITETSELEDEFDPAAYQPAYIQYMKEEETMNTVPMNTAQAPVSPATGYGHDDQADRLFASAPDLSVIFNGDEANDNEGYDDMGMASILVAEDAWTQDFNAESDEEDFELSDDASTTPFALNFHSAVVGGASMDHAGLELASLDHAGIRYEAPVEAPELGMAA